MEDVIIKIQKLLKLEESAKKVGSLEEAANAAAKARDLLMKHNLDLYKVTSYNERPKEEQVGHMMGYPGDISPKTEGDWVRDLTQAIAEFNMCYVIGTGKVRGQIYIIGTYVNTQITWFTVEQLVNRIRPMARDSFSKYKGHEKRNTYIRGFLDGAVIGIYQKLAEQKARETWEAQQAARGLSNDETAVMRVNMAIEQRRKVEEYIDNNFNLSGGKAQRQKSSESGKAQGYIAGYEMEIHSGLAQPSTITKRLN